MTQLGLDCEEDYRKIRESAESCQVKPHSKPWIVYLSEKTLSCGGTLIGKKTVLTASHCICPKDSNNPLVPDQFVKNPHCTLWKTMTAVLGEHDRTNTNCKDSKDNEQCIKIQHGEAHPKWNGKLFKRLF